MEEIEKRIIEVLKGRNDVTRGELKDAIKKACNGIKEDDIDYVINTMIGSGVLRSMSLAKKGDSIDEDDFTITISPKKPASLPPNQPH